VNEENFLSHIEHTTCNLEVEPVFNCICMEVLKNARCFAARFFGCTLFLSKLIRGQGRNSQHTMVGQKYVKRVKHTLGEQKITKYK